MQIFTIAEITRHIKQLFDRDKRLVSVYVRGEISNFKRHSSGHCYLTLKDNDAVIKAVMFRSRSQFLKFEPRDGLKVIAGGYITIFERDGQYQLYIDQLVPEGVGELSLAFEQLKEKLTTEGLFSDERKKPLPLLPKSVGIVTSLTGAAVRDIITVAHRRHPGVELILCPVQVQGPEAPPQIVAAIELLNQYDKVAVIIVGRGGGSLEELWAFNDERVVRAIAASKIPVVSAVGHETDFTLADFVSDRRAATPSQAAELVVPDVNELRRYIKMLTERLETTLLNTIHYKRRHVLQYCDSIVFRRPLDMVVGRQQLLDNHIMRLKQAARNQLETKQHVFTVVAEKLAVLNPMAVLSRGYGIVRRPGGTLIKTAKNAVVNEELEIIMAEGTLQVHVSAIKEADNGPEK